MVSTRNQLLPEKRTQNAAEQKDVEPVPVLGREITRGSRIKQAHARLVACVELFDASGLCGEGGDGAQGLRDLELGGERRQKEPGAILLRLAGDGEVLELGPGAELGVEVLDNVCFGGCHCVCSQNTGYTLKQEEQDREILAVGLQAAANKMDLGAVAKRLGDPAPADRPRFAPGIPWLRHPENAGRCFFLFRKQATELNPVGDMGERTQRRRGMDGFYCKYYSV